MARIRSTKPEFYLDPDVQSLSIPARFLYQGMWCQADDRGRLLDHPALICAQVFAPTDRVRPDVLISELAAGREPRILRYEARGKRLIAIRWFRFHQKISKPQESRLPAPPRSSVTEPFQGLTREEYAAVSPTGSGTVPPLVEEQEAGHSPPELEVELGSGTGRGTEEGEGEPLAPERRDEMFEALAESCEIDWRHLTPSARGELNKATKALREAGDANPAEIRYRVGAYRRTYPSMALTPSALAKHWPALANGARRTEPLSTADRILIRSREEATHGESAGQGAGRSAGRGLPPA